MTCGSVQDFSLSSGLDAVILAGGSGTRLRDAISDIPKVLADIRGKPFIDYLIDWLSSWGIKRYILCVGYGSERIKKYVTEAKSFANLEMVFSEEGQPLGTGGCLRLAARHFRSNPVLVVNGDTFLGISISDFVRFHSRHEADVTVGAVWVENSTSFGALEIDSTSRICAFREKAETGGPAYINGGVYLLDKLVARSITEGFQSLEKDLLPQWLHSRKVIAFQGEFKFVDIGTPERYLAAQTLVPLYVRETCGIQK